MLINHLAKYRELWLFACLQFIALGLPAHPNSEQHRDWIPRANQILSLQKRGSAVEALVNAERLVKDLAVVDPRNKLLAEAWDKVADLERAGGHYEAAERGYKESIRRWEHLSVEATGGLATELNNLASLYSTIRQYRRAEIVSRKSLALRQKLYGAGSPKVALSLSNLAVYLYGQKKYGEADQACKAAIEIWNKALTYEPNQADLAYNTLALIKMHHGQYSSALTFAERALQLYSQRAGAELAQVAGYQHTIALAFEFQGELEKSLAAFHQSLQAIAKSDDSNGLDRTDILLDYSQLLRRLNRKKEAKLIQNVASARRVAIASANHLQYSVDVSAFAEQQR